MCVHVCNVCISDLEAEDVQHESHNAVQCTVVADVTSASCEAETRRDSGISVTTTGMSELPLLCQQAAIMEEPSCDVSTASDEASQPLSVTVPAILPWISLPTDQGYSYCW